MILQLQSTFSHALAINANNDIVGSYTTSPRPIALRAGVVTPLPSSAARKASHSPSTTAAPSSAGPASVPRAGSAASAGSTTRPHGSSAALPKPSPTASTMRAGSSATPPGAPPHDLRSLSLDRPNHPHQPRRPRGQLEQHRLRHQQPPPDRRRQRLHRLPLAGRPDLQPELPHHPCPRPDDHRRPRHQRHGTDCRAGDAGRAVVCGDPCSDLLG